jgi:hypothetical protein
MDQLQLMQVLVLVLEQTLLVLVLEQTLLVVEMWIVV